MEPATSSSDAPLSAGKHLAVRYSLEGTVKSETVRAVSRRLIFFTLTTDDGAAHECLAKGRDRSLTDSEIELLASRLAGAVDGSIRVRITGFPEVAEEGGRSLHVIQAALLNDDPPTLIPQEAREPEEFVPVAIVPRKTSGNHERPNNAYRHRHLVGWLLETFGRQFLCSGAGILDVAGGAGGVAFELSFRHGIPCTVVDPRQMKLNSKQRRALTSRANSQAILSSAAPPPNSPAWMMMQQQGQQPDAAATAAWRSGGSSAAGGADGTDNDSIVAADISAEACAPCDDEANAGICAVPISYATAWQAEGLTTPPPKQICGLFDNDFAEGPHAELWRSCSVVVGMHPDQATEPIVRLALRAGKPFAVVPCCVFYKSHPNRRLADGTSVQTHEQFCDYLAALGEEYGSSRVGRGNLNGFEGRNVVVYGLGERTEEREQVRGVM